MLQEHVPERDWGFKSLPRHHYYRNDGGAAEVPPEFGHQAVAFPSERYRSNHLR